MSNKIYKYKLDPHHDEQVIQMPNRARILKVDEQDRELFLWAMIDDDNEDKDYHIRILGTGMEIPMEPDDPLYKHLNTVVMSYGLVWHVFELIKIKK